MRDTGSGIPEILDRLESFYGPQRPGWPADPYDFLIWWHCGYPASDAACAKGWAALNAQVGIAPAKILEAGNAKLARALKAGGMVPELRAMRLMEIAARVQDEYGGGLRAGLAGPLAKVRQALKRFPGIADPGADRILLFAGVAPVAAVPSNCPQVLVRIGRGRETANYGLSYRQAQEALVAGTPANFGARTRAYLLVKRHGQELCKRANPKCDGCPVSSWCAYFARAARGGYGSS